MESFGRLLRAARESKNIDIETAANETVISKTYLQALEQERIDLFPSETYLMGFLKNYAEYLEVDVGHITSLYRAKKIQEAPTPPSLLQRTAPRFVKPLIISLISLAVIGIGVTLWFIFFNKEEVTDETTVVSDQVTSGHYTLTDQPLTKRVYKGDIIAVPTKEGDIDLIVGQTLNELQLITPAGTQTLELSEERELDIDGQGGAEIIIYLSDISRTDDSRGAEVRVLLKDESAVVSAKTDMESIPAADQVANQRYTIHEDNRAYPFTLNITVRAACMLRYRIDSKDPIEDYYAAGDLVTIQASNGIRLWVSNINAIKIQVQAGLRNYDLEIGKAGQVVAEDIKWIRDNDGTYRLVVIGLD